jgi:hypothetical protein
MTEPQPNIERVFIMILDSIIETQLQMARNRFIATLGLHPDCKQQPFLPISSPFHLFPLPTHALFNSTAIPTCLIDSQKLFPCATLCQDRGLGVSCPRWFPYILFWLAFFRFAFPFFRSFIHHFDDPPFLLIGFCSSLPAWF